MPDVFDAGRPLSSDAGTEPSLTGYGSEPQISSNPVGVEPEQNDADHTTVDASAAATSADVRKPASGPDMEPPRSTEVDDASATEFALKGLSALVDEGAILKLLSTLVDKAGNLSLDQKVGAIKRLGNLASSPAFKRLPLELAAVQGVLLAALQPRRGNKDPAWARWGQWDSFLGDTFKFNRETARWRIRLSCIWRLLLPVLERDDLGASRRGDRLDWPGIKRAVVWGEQLRREQEERTRQQDHPGQRDQDAGTEPDVESPTSRKPKKKSKEKDQYAPLSKAQLLKVVGERDETIRTKTNTIEHLEADLAAKAGRIKDLEAQIIMSGKIFDTAQTLGIAHPETHEASSTCRISRRQVATEGDNC